MRDAWIGRERDARNEGEETQVWEKNKEEKEKEKERKKKGKKERRKIKKEGNERREGKGVVAGHGRWSPAAAGGRRNPVSQAQVQENMGCKYSSYCENGVFTKGVSESEAIAHRTEHDEEKKMTWSLVAKVEYMVAEMVEKVVVEMGSLVFHGGKEEEEGGMEVLLLLEMEE